MKCLFNKLDVISSSSLGKKKKKTINKHLNSEVLLKETEYEQLKLRNKTEIFVEDKTALVFSFAGKYIRTLKYLEKTESFYPTIILDSGALDPLQRGSNVMAPGVFKYLDRCSGNFKKGDVVEVHIIDLGLLALGLSLVDKQNITSRSSGEAVEIIHIKIDELYKCY